MNVYDFDKTITTKDSTAEFLKWLIRRKPSLVRYLPAAGFAFLRHALKLADKTAAKQTLFRIFRGVDDMEASVEAFWNSHMGLIKPWYETVRKPDDVVISASPEFLIKPICERLGIGCAMASVVDPETGVYSGVNCHGAEKVRRFYEAFPNGHIECFYSDSLIDGPLAAEADLAFLVTGESTRPWPEVKKR
ncbi:MAG: HAD-IB family phosphatase [Clostridia bacterium]|nr:HAD-IB family phosphatase [Clostridia bacterium]